MSTNESAPASGGPLAGIRVLEVATFVAAPAAGALLAELGAEVIKMEVPAGELLRHTRPRHNGFRSDFDGSPQFEMENRGKESLALDLNNPAARAALLKVIDGVDVVLTNMLPGRCRRFGIDPESLREKRPELIYASLTGYGNRGAEADSPSFDYAALWARTGMMDLTRDPSAPPAFLRPGVGDHSAALSLVCGILAALRVRDAGGGGQVVDVSLLQTGLYLQGNDLSQTLATGNPAPMHDRSAPRNPLWNHYETRDGRWVMLVMIESGRYWPGFARAIGRPELEADPRFVGPVERYRQNRELVEILDAVFAAHSLSEWEEKFAGHSVIWAPVRRLEETRDDPQIQTMGYFRTVEHPELGAFETVGPPLSMSGHPMPSNAPAPGLGADSSQVLRAAGLNEIEIEAALAPPGGDNESAMKKGEA
ncbi:MAG: CoA transferase [Myxococcota bacterium]|jgi:crotonobetainyl-CoA:carnitine CoA-transferase CaiB-like acyl-CoA transferase|nr:CoA transferase [Myxococcota bacterium]